MIMLQTTKKRNAHTLYTNPVWTDLLIYTVCSYLRILLSIITWITLIHEFAYPRTFWILSLVFRIFSYFYSASLVSNNSSANCRDASLPYDDHIKTIVPGEWRHVVFRISWRPSSNNTGKLLVQEMFRASPQENGSLRWLSALRRVSVLCCKWIRWSRCRKQTCSHL